MILGFSGYLFVSQYSCITTVYSIKYDDDDDV